MQGTHMGGPGYIPDADLEWGESKWLAKGNLEEMPHKSDSHLIRLFHFFFFFKWFKPPRGLDSLWAWLSIHMYCNFLTHNKHFTCFTILHHHGNSLQSQRARALSLTTGLVVRIWCSHGHTLTSIPGQKLKSCFKPLQAKVTWGSRHLVLLGLSCIACA